MDDQQIEALKEEIRELRKEVKRTRGLLRGYVMTLGLGLNLTPLLLNTSSEIISMCMFGAVICYFWFSFESIFAIPERLRAYRRSSRRFRDLVNQPVVGKRHSNFPHP